MNQTSSSHTVCLRSTDARMLEEGVYNWNLKSENCKRLSNKMYLASIELPLSQWSVESEWNRVYVLERLHILQNRREFSLTYQTESENNVAARTTIRRILPLHLNRITSIQKSANVLTVRTEEKHGLSYRMFDWILKYEERVKMVGTDLGMIDISSAWEQSRLTIEGDNTFVIRTVPDVSDGVDTDASLAIETYEGGHLFFASPPSLAALADMISMKLQDSVLAGAIKVVFDAEECRFTLSVLNYPNESRMLKISIIGDDLSTLMGFDSGEHTFRKNRPDPRTQGYAADTGRHFLQGLTAVSYEGSREYVGDKTPLRISSDASSMFGYAELRPGCYFPCQRSYGTSSPLRLQGEWGLQFDRLFFSNNADEPRRGIVYTDPLGYKRILEIVEGAYTPESMATYITRGMNESADGFVYEAKFESERFVLSCRSQKGYGLAFALHFAHPRSIEPERLGFEETTMDGSDTYESSTPVHFPNSEFGVMKNLYHISEIKGQRKLSIRPSAQPILTCVAEEYTEETRTLRVRGVFNSGEATSHALVEGTVVSLHAGTTVETTEHRHERTTEDLCMLAVITRGSESGSFAFLDISVAPGKWVADAVENRQTITITQSIEPCSFCFVPRLHRSIGGERLGFSNSTVQWGVDGTVRSKKLSIPPFVSTGSHNLDHVDFVLLRVREGKGSTTLSYETNSSVVHVFGKVCLNPVFRNERHLPVETAMVGHDRFDSFTVEVLNPDLTPYHFHGATWSLSVTFV